MPEKNQTMPKGWTPQSLENLGTPGGGFKVGPDQPEKVLNQDAEKELNRLHTIQDRQVKTMLGLEQLLINRVADSGDTEMVELFAKWITARTACNETSAKLLEQIIIASTPPEPKT